MSYLAPDGPVYQAGTLSGNFLLAMAAGYNMVKTSYDNPSIYVKLEKTTATLENASTRFF